MKPSNVLRPAGNLRPLTPVLHQGLVWSVASTCALSDELTVVTLRRVAPDWTMQEVVLLSGTAELFSLA